MVNQTGNAYISGTTNDSIENSTQNIGVSTIEKYINVPLKDSASDRQLEMATWHVSFAITMAPRAYDTIRYDRPAQASRPDFCIIVIIIIYWKKQVTNVHA